MGKGMTRLADGREAHHVPGSGRFRDRVTGRWVRAGVEVRSCECECAWVGVCGRGCGVQLVISAPIRARGHGCLPPFGSKERTDRLVRFGHAHRIKGSASPAPPLPFPLDRNSSLTCTLDDTVSPLSPPQRVVEKELTLAAKGPEKDSPRPVKRTRSEDAKTSSSSGGSDRSASPHSPSDAASSFATASPRSPTNPTSPPTLPSIRHLFGPQLHNRPIVRLPSRAAYPRGSSPSSYQSTSLSPPRTHPLPLPPPPPLRTTPTLQEAVPGPEAGQEGEGDDPDRDLAAVERSETYAAPSVPVSPVETRANQPLPSPSTGAKSTYDREKTYKCNMCPKSRSSLCPLSRQETEDYRLKGFTRNYDLTRHRSSHQDARLHVCRHCGRAFNRRDALVRHNLIRGCARSGPGGPFVDPPPKLATVDAVDSNATYTNTPPPPPTTTTRGRMESGPSFEAIVA